MYIYDYMFIFSNSLKMFKLQSVKYYAHSFVSHFEIRKISIIYFKQVKKKYLKRTPTD